MKQTSRRRQVASFAALVLTTLLLPSANARSVHQSPSQQQHVTSAHSARSPRRSGAGHSAVHKLSSHQVVSAPGAPTWYGGSVVQPSLNGGANHAVVPHSRSASNRGDYLSQMGGESRWCDGKCIHVYVAPGRPSFPGMVSDCLNQWCTASGHKFSYALTNDPRQADYTINWTKRTHELSTGDECGLTTTDTYIDRGSAKEYIDHAHTRVLTRYEGKRLSDEEIQRTILHEIGHGLGLEGHSSNPGDIMYYAVSRKQSSHLTPRDASTMARLYGS